MKQVLHSKSAVKGKNKFDLSREHLTTLDIGQIIPAFHQEVIPGDTFHIESSGVFSRVAPLEVPTYGQCQLKFLPIFVPYHQVYQYYDAWISGKKVEKSAQVGFLWFDAYDILHLFMQSQYSTSTSASAFDFWGFTGTTTITAQKRKFTAAGRYLYKIFRSLGYQIIGVSGRYTSIPNLQQFRFNAMPLLCWLKAYNDYFTLSSYYDVSPLTRYLEDVRTWPNGEQHINLIDLFVTTLPATSIKVMYDNSYFTSAWKNPNAPNGSVTSSQEVRNFNLGPSFGDVSIDADNNATYNSEVSDNSTLSAYGLRALQSFDAWIRRNNYAGSKSVQRILSRFGIKTEDYDIYFAHVVGKPSIMNLRIGDVTSTAQTDLLSLGDYSGKGIISDSIHNVSFKSAKDYGMLFYMAWINVKPIYSNGIDKLCLKLDRYDFYTPEFDGIGPQAISQGELNTDMSHSFVSANFRFDSVYGFTERYNDYRLGRSQITGDLALKDTFVKNQSWHLDRTDLTDIQDHGDAFGQSQAMSLVDGNIFNRIFQGPQDGSVDHFYIDMNFNVSAFRPILDLTGAAMLPNGDITMDKNGNSVH